MASARLISRGLAPPVPENAFHTTLQGEGY
jgi:hypothetical protein